MCDDRERLIGYVYDECDRTERRLIEEHVAGCETCRIEISGLQRVRQDLLAWEVPQRESVWRPFVPARVAPTWRDIPAWGLAAAACLLLAAGAAGGVATHALLPHQKEAAIATAVPVPVTPAANISSPRPEELSALERRLLATLRAEMNARVQELATASPRAAGRRTVPDEFTSEVSALRAAQFDTLRAVNADLRMLNSRTVNLEQREQKTNLLLTSLVAQQGGNSLFSAGQ